jgi:hypothetical protein
MENPATWGKAERIVDKAIGDHDTAMQRGITGLSLVRHITDALREAGLLKEGPGDADG